MENEFEPLFFETLLLIARFNDRSWSWHRCCVNSMKLLIMTSRR
jgi:hypothetical protein